jgi:hypothetical protein
VDPQPPIDALHAAADDHFDVELATGDDRIDGLVCVSHHGADRPHEHLSALSQLVDDGIGQRSPEIVVIAARREEREWQNGDCVLAGDRLRNESVELELPMGAGEIRAQICGGLISRGR